ncbi:nucleoside triphosphate pyrophosphohydrolase [Candidatus Pseudoscillospira sp. SGI.172]|uniref:nucleoside triphosphate pyrophosphohydrolase n=1 Tax=Candidatus Pseudoscillospira sp. SGI.172 TaxID=3420582 RepID=UPI002A7E7E14|nr:nucleoside triphosphate pyrophosphohydrolase [Pseudoflavonifractor sp.]MDY3018714.1 nucleoside triphosphate pyrophosphohydrolase [Oscillospiraceae bacterium]
MIDFVKKDSYSLNDLEHIVSILRAPGGCPWDGEQTHESLRRGMLEESYEVVEAIDEGSASHLKEELGDVLLQVVFHADIEKDAGRFTLDDVADGICKKLIFRHPHVFGDVSVSGSDEVLVNWEVLKREEKGQETYSDTLRSVARSLPALWRAEKVQKKAKKAGFDWPDASGAMDKLSEELEELKQAVTENSNVAEELGDLLFAAVNVSRFIKADPEETLTAATDKFISRFEKVERLAAQTGQDMAELPLEELDKLWEEAKRT